MGYYVIYILTKERINMSKENIKTSELIKSITNKDSLTAVRIAMNINDLTYIVNGILWEYRKDNL